MWNRYKRIRNYESRIAIALPLLAVLVTSVATAQEVKPYVLPHPPKDTSTFLGFKEVSGGPYFTAGISRQNVNLPAGDGWHSSPRFAYAFGGTIDFSLNQWFGIDFTALYDSRDLYLATTGDSQSLDLGLGYVSFAPSIRLFWLLVGLTFDIPMSGSATQILPNYPAAGQKYSANLNEATGDLNFLTEVRGTLSIPVVEGDGATLHVIVSGSYPLSNVLNTRTPAFNTTGVSPPGHFYFSGPAAPGQGPLPTIEAGISYQFDLLH